MSNKKELYESIIRESLGKEYIEQVEIIKIEQCSTCEKRGKDKCRLNIRDSKCINYINKRRNN